VLGLDFSFNIGRRFQGGVIISDDGLLANCPVVAGVKDATLIAILLPVRKVDNIYRRWVLAWVRQNNADVPIAFDTEGVAPL
jgi:hypothetical protein